MATTDQGSPTSDHRIQLTADSIRFRVFEHVMANDGGYLSQACSSAELLATLYNVAKLAPLDSPKKPEPFQGVPGKGATYINGADFHGAPGPDFDRIIISPAHYALVIYAALIEMGRLDEEALELFNQDGSTVEMIGAEHSPGFESTTGSLAQALSTAGGIALGRRLKSESGLVYVFMSDGEFQEGQTWEAIQALSFHKLDNVRVIVDVNKGQCDGPMSEVMNIEPLSLKIRAFGGSVDTVNGHDIVALTTSLTRTTGKPHFVLANTDPVRGIPVLKEREPMLHYLRFSNAEEQQRYADAFAEMEASR